MTNKELLEYVIVGIYHVQELLPVVTPDISKQVIAKMSLDHDLEIVKRKLDDILYDSSNEVDILE